LAARLRPWLPTFVILWAVGGLLFVLRLALGWRAAQRLATVGLTVPPQAISAAMSRVSARLNLQRPVQLWQSTQAEVPLVVGCWRPVVLLPVSLASGLAPDQLESLLAHELAHVRRHDFLVNLLQALVETLFFYHPAMWWLSSRIRIERENCCDDLAVAVCSNRLGYARALVALEELRGVSASLALGANGGSLLDRVRRIAGVPCEPRPSAVAVLASSLIVVLAIASSVWARPAAAPRQQDRITQAKPQARPAVDVVQLAFAEAENPPTSTTAEAVPEGWFRPDPYGHLGIVDNAGAGWHYVRLLADESAGRQLHTTTTQRDAAHALYQAFMEKDRALEAELRKRGKLTVPDWPQARAAQWMQARAAARALLNDEQHQRVEQLMIQRLSYHAFRDVRDGSGANSGMRGKALAETLLLTPEQTAQIEAAIAAHHKRVRDNQKDLDLAKGDRAPEADGAVEQERIRDLTRRKVQLGVQSHRQVWDDVFRIFTPQQRRKFDELRGPAVEATQP
jgi:beta-lactamase regulating signal transducer with metallopeptidase domain